MPAPDLSRQDARRIAIKAQGLAGRSSAGRVDVRHLRRTIRSMNLLQLDFVNVLVPAHYLVLYSRVGAYDRSALERLVFDRRDCIEHWAHEACIVPTEDWPLLAYRRQSFKPWTRGPLSTLTNRTKYLQQIIEIVEKNGACTAQDMPQMPAAARRPGDWHRSAARSALEYHFGVGRVAISRRLSNFQRVYDLAERVVSADIRSQRVAAPDAHRELLRRAATALGIGTLDDLADYYRMTRRMAEPRILELVEEGILREVTVDGWQQRAWLVRGTRRPKIEDRAVILSPFDPLVWYRPRAERLFDFHYRIEIYVPEQKRRWGYYVLPVLVGDQLVGRVDLKAERLSKTLSVRAAYLEAGADEKSTVDALAPELRRLAHWLGLETVKVGRKGNLSRALRQASAAKLMS